MGKGKNMLITILYFAPIVISIAALIICLIRGVNKRALILSAMITMVAEMFAMKYIASTWYIFLFSMTVPMAVSYTLFSLYMSIKENKNDGKEDEK
ncbi:MAG: hypothetical protein UIJ88_03795 [Anaerovoracaceae bacterium]|nr:hypothetical protein [Anaerovoracaceae bacterium]